MLENEDVNMANEVCNFKELLELWDDIVFGDAVYEINKRRETLLRRPEQLPNEEDMVIIRDHILNRIKVLTSDKMTFFTKTEYVELRDVVLAKLIILNGQRHGEPAKLTFND